MVAGSSARQGRDGRRGPPTPHVGFLVPGAQPWGGWVKCCRHGCPWYPLPLWLSSLYGAYWVSVEVTPGGQTLSLAGDEVQLGKVSQGRGAQFVAIQVVASSGNKLEMAPPHCPPHWWDAARVAGVSGGPGCLNLPSEPEDRERARTWHRSSEVTFPRESTWPVAVGTGSSSPIELQET